MPTGKNWTDTQEGALRLLRPGGIVLVNAVLPGSTPTERMPTDAEAAAAAELREQVRADDRLVPLLLPIGHGPLAAAKQAAAGRSPVENANAEASRVQAAGLPRHLMAVSANSGVKRLA